MKPPKTNIMKQEDIIKFTEEVFNFERKYGSLAIDEGFGVWSYACKNKGYYAIPEEVTSEQIEELITKSLADNHDYVFDLVGKKENEIIYEEGCIY